MKMENLFQQTKPRRKQESLHMQLKEEVLT